MTLVIKLVGGEVRIEPKGYDLLSPHDSRPPRPKRVPETPTKGKL